jgi:transcription antitermination protein NusB
MPPRKQPRSIARELALLSISQVPRSSEKIEQQQLEDLLRIAVRTITAEIQETLETAAAEVKRGGDRLIESQTRTNNLESAKATIADALELAQKAINRLGIVVELPEFLQLANQIEVREYALELIKTVLNQRENIEKQIEDGLVAWQLSRLPQIDRDILQIAVAEILYLEVPKQVAIDEAVELAKRYSDEEGHRFINGVLRRVTDNLEKGLGARD